MGFPRPALGPTVNGEVNSLGVGTPASGVAGDLVAVSPRSAVVGTGAGNEAFGQYALGSNTTGNYNSAVGQYALGYNTTGFGNAAMGQYALSDNTTGNYNSAFGYNAGSNNAPGQNYTTCLGYNTASGYDGGVAIGTDHLGNWAVAEALDQFVLGTPNHTVVVPGHLQPTYSQPALPANPPVSGTVYQNTTGGTLTIIIPITATAIGGSAQLALGSTNTPGVWGGAEQIGVSGELHNVTLDVPNDWYWSVTVVSATIGTANTLGS